MTHASIFSGIGSPEVMYEIFRAIEISEKIIKKNVNNNA